MTMRYMVGMRIERKSAAITVVAEDALVAALKAKLENPAAMITYVRKSNDRGDLRHPHRDIADPGR
jgi:hypothetical protein